jgi:hypothetical protein
MKECRQVYNLVENCSPSMKREGATRNVKAGSTATYRLVVLEIDRDLTAAVIIFGSIVYALRGVCVSIRAITLTLDEQTRRWRRRDRDSPIRTARRKSVRWQRKAVEVFRQAALENHLEAEAKIKLLGAGREYHASLRRRKPAAQARGFRATSGLAAGPA